MHVRKLLNLTLNAHQNKFRYTQKVMAVERSCNILQFHLNKYPHDFWRQRGVQKHTEIA